MTKSSRFIDENELCLIKLI